MDATNLPGNATSMTAMKITRELLEIFREAIRQNEPNATTPEVSDDDIIFENYFVILPDGEFTLAPDADEFFSIFKFVKEEEPGKFAPIEYI